MSLAIYFYALFSHNGKESRFGSQNPGLDGARRALIPPRRVKRIFKIVGFEYPLDRLRGWRISHGYHRDPVVHYFQG